MVTAPPHSVKSNRIYSELERTAHRPRVMVNPAYLPDEDYLDTPTMLEFDYTDYEPDVWSTTSAGLHLQTILNEKIRDIRLQAQNLLDKQSPSRFEPPVRRPIVYYTSSQYEMPETKYDNEYKIHTLRDVQRDVQDHVFNKSLYNEPVRRANIGKGHLSCMTYAGGKPQAVRRKKYVPDFDQDKVLNDVTYLSYYDKTQSEVNRQHTDLLRHKKVPYGGASYEEAFNIRAYPVPPMDIVDKKYYYGDAYFKGVYGTHLRRWAAILWNLQDMRYTTTRGKLLSAHALHSLKIEPIQVKQYRIITRGKKTKESKVSSLGNAAMSDAERQAAANEAELNRLEERAKRIREARTMAEGESVQETEPVKQIKEEERVKEVELPKEIEVVPEVEMVVIEAEPVLEEEPVKVVELEEPVKEVQPVQEEEPVKVEVEPVPEEIPQEVEEVVKPKKKKKSKQPVEEEKEKEQVAPPEPPVQEEAPVPEAKPEPEPIPATPAEEPATPVEEPPVEEPPAPVEEPVTSTEEPPAPAEEPPTETAAKLEASAPAELEIPLEGVSEDAVVQTVQSAIDLTEPTPPTPAAEEAEPAKKEEPVSEPGAVPEKSETDEAVPAAADTGAVPESAVEAEIPPPPAVTEAEAPPAPVEAEVPPAPAAEVPPAKEEPAEAPPAETPAEVPAVQAEEAATPTEAAATPAAEQAAEPVVTEAVEEQPATAAEPQAPEEGPKEAAAETTAAETPAAEPGSVTE